jgi:membrane protease YdiL (CAAX protease family)
MYRRRSRPNTTIHSGDRITGFDPELAELDQAHQQQAVTKEMKMLHTIHTTQVENQIETGAGTIRPLTNWQTMLSFGLPTLLMILFFHWFMPWLQRLGLTPFESMVVSHTVPMALLLPAAVVMFHRVDGYPLTWAVFRQRLRYPALTWRTVLQALGLFLLLLIGYGLFNGVSQMLIARGWLLLPQNLPAMLDPRVRLTTAVLDDMVGGQILANWGIIILYFIVLSFNIVGEELWWRGYLLPRQEVRYGRFAWVWHGLLWTAFHMFKWWDLIGLLPVCLAIAYTSQWTKNNWPAFMAHFLFNGLGLIGVVTAVIRTIG